MAFWLRGAALRIAIVTDIHGNRTAFEAVLRDLKQMSPDLVLHGGDLANSGSSPAEIIDQVRALGWPGVLGNTDEIHTRPESLEEFAASSKAPSSLWSAIREIAAWTHARLGEQRIEWLRSLPRVLFQDTFALVHASPASLWSSPSAESTDRDFQTAYEELDKAMVVYGHIHRGFMRRVPHSRLGQMLVVNSGSVSLSYDGDPRASYVLIDDSVPAIRRVEYDVEREIRALVDCGTPHSDWLARTLRSSSPQLP
jgi:putative phosphoesterase